MSGVYFLRFLKAIFHLLPSEKLYHSLFYLSIYIKTFKQQKIMYQLRQFPIRQDRKHRRNYSEHFLIRYRFENSRMKFSRADSCVKTWRFPDVSGTTSVLILRVCWPPASRIIFEICTSLTEGQIVKAKLPCSGFEPQQTERPNSHPSYF